MDELQRSIYVDRFRLAFHTRKGTAFQDWFVRLAGYAFGPDFEEVRPYGPYGDLRCDGRRISTGSVFQCWLPIGGTRHTIDAARGKCLDQTRRLSAIRNTASTQHSRPRDDGSP